MTTFVRPTYRDLHVYAGDERGCAIDLSDNTNQWGTSPAAVEALQRAARQSPARYPEAYADSLKTAIADYASVPPDFVTTGAGSDDVLDCVFRALAEPGDTVAFPDPSFVMVPVLARANGLHPVSVPLTPRYDADVPALMSTRGRLTYLCSPNNPTGASLSRASISGLVEQAEEMGGIVIVDEAYAEFAASNVLDLVRRSDRVVVTRTLSKAFGLAGARVGYAIAAPSLIAEIEKARGPYKVGAAGIAAGTAALREGAAWTLGCVRQAVAARERLTRELAARGVAVVRSDANFVFAPLARAVDVAAAMRELGVAVRAFRGLPIVNDALAASAGEALRITVAPDDALDVALDAFDRALDATQRGAAT